MTDPTPRWRYRFDNFDRALTLLRQGVELSKTRALSDLENEGVVQRFEYTWELGWKLLRDLLEDDGVILETITPKSVVRAAFEAKLIDQGETWMGALDARNKMSHQYNPAEFEAVIVEIRDAYLGLFEGLHVAVQRKIKSAP